MTLGPGGGERQRPLGGAAGRLGPGRGGRATVVQRRLRPGELRPRLDKGRIERHRLLVGGNRLAETRRVERAHPLRGGLAPQEGIVGGQALRRLRRQLVFGAVPERHVQRLRHLARDVGLHLEHVGHRGVESAAPSGLGARARAHVRPAPG